MKCLPLEKAPIAKIVLPRLGPAITIRIYSHRHVIFERAHEDTHTYTKHSRCSSNHSHLAHHFDPLSPEGNFCKTMCKFILGLHKCHPVIMKIGKMANIIAIQHSVKFNESFF